LRVEPRITSNNQLSLQQMCAAGLGIAAMGLLDVHEELQRGRLVRVLPDWQLPLLEMWAVTPQRDAQPAKVRHAIDSLQGYLRALPGVTT
jgi:DNA-binding transcriptional LysR family regulator